MLFHNTVYHNIAYGNLNASADRVFEAARMANLHDTIMSWPQQYETQVGERGLKLSGSFVVLRRLCDFAVLSVVGSRR